VVVLPQSVARMVLTESPIMGVGRRAA